MTSESRSEAGLRAESTVGRIAMGLFLGLLLFGGIVISLWRAEASRMERLYESLRDEKTQIEIRTMDLERARLSEITDAYAIWSEMADWMNQPAPLFEWGKDVLDDRFLRENSDARLAYSREGRLVAAYVNPGREEARKFAPTADVVRPAISSRRSVVWFVRNGDEVAEIRLATVHESGDAKRVGPASGAIAVVRILDGRWIGEYGRLLGGIASVQADPVTPEALQRARTQGILVSDHSLSGSDGVPVGYLRVEQTRPSLSASLQGGRRSLVVNGLFALFSVAAIGLVLSRWIAIPMGRLVRALTEDRPEALSPLLDRRSDFGQLARAVDGSFRDRARLRAELENRKRTERELREATVRAEEANRTKSAFLAQMSHEIRTPMNGVLGMTELLLNEDLDPVQRDYSVAIQTSATSLLRLLNDVLDLSKIEAGKLALVHEEFFLRGIFEDVARLFAPSLQSKGVRLVCDVAPDSPPKVWGDAQRLQQIVMNLLGNAVKFTEAGEVVLRVDVRLSDGWTPLSPMELIVEVQDSGIGIPADRLDAVFESFSQADETTSVRFGGTGLGLPIARSLARSMGGDIRVTSRVGAGSVFRATMRMEVSGFAGADLTDTVRCRAVVLHESATAARALVRVLESFRWDVRVIGPDDELDADVDYVFFSHGVPRAFAPREGLRRVLLRQIGAGESGLEEADAELREPLRWYEIALLCQVVEPSDVLTRPESSPERLKGLQILVAEDNPINQIVARKTVEQFGCFVTVVPDGKAAVERVRAGGIDIVLMDLQMPIMDGIEATRMIRGGEARSSRRIPILAVTANASPEDRERCLAAGMDDFLPKPFRSDDLLRAIDRLAARVPSPA